MGDEIERTLSNEGDYESRPAGGHPVQRLSSSRGELQPLSNGGRPGAMKLQHNRALTKLISSLAIVTRAATTLGAHLKFTIIWSFDPQNRASRPSASGGAADLGGRRERIQRNYERICISLKVNPATSLFLLNVCRSPS